MALTLLSIFTLVGLVLSAATGWTLSQALGGPVTAARHIAVAIPTVLFSLFTQSMVLFFFIGTGKLLKEAASKRPDAAGRDFILARVRHFKLRTSALCTFAPLSALATGLLGVTAHTGKTPASLHLVAAALCVLLHVVAFGREVVAMAETNQLMDEAATAVPPRTRGRGAVSDAKNAAKVALVTGGTKRLGFEFAKALARNGYSLALSYRSDPDAAGRAIDLLRKEEGGRAEAFRADFAADDAPVKLFEEIFSSSLFSSPSSPRLDVLVHAASPWIPKPFSSVSLADWEAIFRAGPRAAFFLAQAAAPALRASQGSILFVSDVAATQAWPSHIPHAAAKAAINALVRNLAVALGPEVRVNAIAPGVVMPPAEMSAEAIAALVAKTPLARKVDVADLTAMAIAMLENRSLTGQIVAVDAGRMVKGV